MFNKSLLFFENDTNKTANKSEPTTHKEIKELYKNVELSSDMH